MPAVQYPFIDVAVHRAVRPHFARGDALVLFSHDMQTVLWANGAGAAHFGNPSVYEFLEQGPGRRELSFRQLAATAGQLKRSGQVHNLVMRIATGFRSLALQARVELVEIHPGEPVILFSVPRTGAGRGSVDLATEMLAGFDEPDTHMAVLDGQGAVIAASAEFAALQLDPIATRDFIAGLPRAGSPVLKRRMDTARGHLPAALGKVSDDPVMYLLLAVDTARNAADAQAPAADTDQTSAPVVDTVAGTGPEADAPDLTRSADIRAAAGPADGGLSQQQAPADRPADLANEPADAGPVFEDDDQDTPPLSGAAEESRLPAALPRDDASRAEPLPVAPDRPAFVFDRKGRATRFVWKIDRLGRFTEVSPEFAAAVGPRSAAIEGTAFSDLAALFDLDPEGKLRELLGRRDTWSGKTIHWPVEGTSLRVPVDLAALPTYTRNREFDGFRGFGVVRVGDAAEDPFATGLMLADAGGTPALDVQEIATSQAATSLIDETVETDVQPSGDTANDRLADELHQPLTGDDTDTAQTFTANDVAVEDDGADLQAGQAIDGEPAVAPEQGEPPAPPEPPPLFTASMLAPESDKVIQLDTHRQRRDGLSVSETAAFLEIGRTLDAVREPDARSSARAEGPAQDDAIDHEDDRDENLVEATDHTRAPLVDDGQDAPDDAAFLSSNGDGDAPSLDDLADKGASFEPLQIYGAATGRGDVPLSADIVDLMPLALLVHRGDHLIHANPDFLRLTGYAGLDALAEAGGLDALLQREDLDDAEGRVSRMVVVCADDTLVPVTARLQSVRWDTTNALMMSLVPLEPAAATPSEAPAPAPGDAGELARLRVEVEEMRSILETATDGVVLISTEGEIRSMNRSASALFDYDGEEIRGKPFVTLFAHESQKAILDYLAGLTGHGVASVLNDGREVIGREASGGFLPLFMTIGKLTSSNGFCAVIRDITQWKRTEDELRSAKRAAETANAHKSDFLARVSHEIRTPLNAIIGFADIMSNEHFGPIGHSRYSEYASDIVRSGRHVLDIVNDLLDISKIEAGEMELDFTAIGLNETVSQAAAIVQPQANSQRVIIRTALSQAVPNVVADLRSIKQIVLNILANAIRFTPSGGQIIVSTAYEANGSVVLRIRDTGVGMSRSELEQAMKPFQQVSGTVRPRGDGTGLGLPLTKAMVDANRAHFAISSVPNEGTLVEITFPSQRVLAD
ncbi:PAS domain-containing sensor histidine kinase [Rhizobium halophytocola]|uniref:histidine kinase n=1 Tax=Rhizobium halophytocola TaxID=735519 RepID=A0ABS4E6H7_9HYPH|nr:PAS domain-containing sensor histidine kinase [Rhizobium halophytocola]MBP1853541.1 PAS domain S-box-containing protein [Rhizobium halophytocola]